MAKDYKEWFDQSDYDLTAAENMFSTGSFIYSVFLCHLSVEKYLKGLYLKELLKEPPKLHGLIFFIENIGIEIPSHFRSFILDVDDAAVATRYPDSLTKLSVEFDKESTLKILSKTKEFLQWLKNEYKK